MTGAGNGTKKKSPHHKGFNSGVVLLSRLLVVYERGVVGHLPSNEVSNKLGGTTE